MAPLVQLRPSVRSGQTHAPREREAGRVLCLCEREANRALDLVPALDEHRQLGCGEDNAARV